MYRTSSRIACRRVALLDREQRHLRALAGDVSGGDDPRQRKLRDEPDPDRARGREVRAERAGEQHLLDVALVDPELLDEEPPARSRSPPSRTAAPGRRAATGRPRRSRSPSSPCQWRTKIRSPSSRAVRREASSGAMSARLLAARRSGRTGRAGRRRTSSAPASTRPEPQMPIGSALADHVELDRIRRGARTTSIAPVGRPHPAADLGGLERRPGRCGGADDAARPSRARSRSSCRRR